MDLTLEHGFVTKNAFEGIGFRQGCGGMTGTYCSIQSRSSSGLDLLIVSDLIVEKAHDAPRKVVIDDLGVDTGGFARHFVDQFTHWVVEAFSACAKRLNQVLQHFLRNPVVTLKVGERGAERS